MQAGSEGQESSAGTTSHGDGDGLPWLLAELLAIDATDLKSALTEASTRVGEALAAEKVDAFLLEPATQTLVAVGASDSPLSARQRALQLDKLPLAHSGL